MRCLRSEVSLGRTTVWFSHLDRRSARVMHEPRRHLTTILVMSQTLPLSEIKAHLSEIVDRVEHEHERVILTRNGRPAAVLMSTDDLEALEDTLDLLSDDNALREIVASRKDVAAGRVVDADALRFKYLGR